MAQVRKISAYFAVVVGLALLLSGCALAGRTFGRYVDDKTLTGSVKMSLATLHVSHLKRVNVDVYDGTVYLSGIVNTPAEKSDASRMGPSESSIARSTALRSSRMLPGHGWR